MDNSEEAVSKGIERIREARLHGKIIYRKKNTMSVKLETGRVKSASRNENIQYAVSILSNGRIGQTRGNRIQEIPAMIEKAVALTRVGQDAYFRAWPEPQESTPVRFYSQSTGNMDMSDLKGALNTCVDIIRGFDSNLHIEGEAYVTHRDTICATTGGVFSIERKNDWTIWVIAQRTHHDDILMTGDMRKWGDRNEYFDPEQMVNSIITDIELAHTTVSITSGRWDVLLHPNIVGAFIQPLVIGINGLNVEKGSSPLKGRIGERILADTITITDNPHIDFSPGARMIDTDGVPTRKHALFKKGVLQKYLYDLNTAGLAGTEPTGNVACCPYYPVMEAGEHSFKDLVNNIDRGIYIKQLLGFGQSNLINGDYCSNIGLGYLIERGEIKGRVKNTMISGNIYEQLKNAVILSKDTDYAGYMPYLLFENGIVATS